MCTLCSLLHFTLFDITVQSCHTFRYAHSSETDVLSEPAWDLTSLVRVEAVTCCWPHISKPFIDLLWLEFHKWLHIYLVILFCLVLCCVILFYKYENIHNVTVTLLHRVFSMLVTAISETTFVSYICIGLKYVIPVNSVVSSCNETFNLFH